MKGPATDMDRAGKADAPDGAALAAVCMAGAQVSVNVGAALGKTLFASVGPEGVAALRTSIAAILLLTIARPWRTMPTRRHMGWLLLYGLTLGSMNLLIYATFARIPIGVAVAIEICGPLGVVLATSRSLRDFLWLGLAIGGLLLLAPWPGVGARLDPAGIGFALAAALAWALYILFGKRAAQVKGTTAVALGMTIACCITLPFGVAAAGGRLLDPSVLRLGIGVALLSSALPYALEMKALGHLSTRAFGVLTSAAPAVAALVGYVILGERLTPAQWLAVALMIAASAGGSLSGRRGGSR